MDRVYILTEEKIVYLDYLRWSAALTLGLPHPKFIDCAFWFKESKLPPVALFGCLCDGHSISGFAGLTGGSIPLDSGTRHTLLCSALP